MWKKASKLYENFLLKHHEGLLFPNKYGADGNLINKDLIEDAAQTKMREGVQFS